LFEVTISQAQGRVPVSILRLEGKFDAIGADEFDRRAKEVVEAGAKNVLVDMSQVEYMSSAGLRCIHNLFYQLHPEGSEEYNRIIDEGIPKGTYKAPYMKLLNPNKRVQESLRMVGIDMYMDILSGDAKRAVGAF
jgi:anti-sigma B factor antagonist